MGDDVFGLSVIQFEKLHVNLLARFENRSRTFQPNRHVHVDFRRSHRLVKFVRNLTDADAVHGQKTLHDLDGLPFRKRLLAVEIDFHLGKIGGPPQDDPTRILLNHVEQNIGVRFAQFERPCLLFLETGNF